VKNIKKYKLFLESESFKDSIKLERDNNFIVDYTFEDNLGNKFLVQFKNIKIGKNNLGKGYNVSYFVWDVDSETWSVSKIVKSNPWRIVRTVLHDILNDFISRKSWCNKIQFEGLSKELQKSYISQRTNMYIRFLKTNPLPGFEMKNYGNTIVLEKNI
jgi:hypothetical protein